MTQSPPSNNTPSIGRFARFFRGYGVGLSLVVATLPIFISNFEIIPVFTTTKNIITIITSVTSYLLVGFIFSQRYYLADIYFPGRLVGSKRVVYRKQLTKMNMFGLLPIFFAVLFIILFVWFNLTVRTAVNIIAYENALYVRPDNPEPEPIQTNLNTMTESGTTQARLQSFGLNELIRINYRVSFTEKRERIFTYSVQFPNEQTIQSILKSTPSTNVPYQTLMTLQFLGMFVFATSAFILMGLKDYLQSDLGLSDDELLRNPPIPTIKERFDVKTLPGVFGIMEYSPASPEIEPIFSGPLCVFHQLPPDPDSVDSATGRVTKWVHRTKDSNGNVKTQSCSLDLQVTWVELGIELQRGGREAFARRFALMDVQTVDTLNDPATP